MPRLYAQLLKLARERLTFLLACSSSPPNPAHFRYSCGYTSTLGMLDAYAEFDRPLGPPKAGAKSTF